MFTLQLLGSLGLVSAVFAAWVARILGSIGRQAGDLLEHEHWASAPLVPDRSR